MLEKLQRASSRLGVHLDGATTSKLLRYVDAISLWNKTYNLTAITKPNEMLTKHIIDSLSAVPYLSKKAVLKNENAAVGNLENGLENSLESSRLLDVGAGAGLPGLVVAMVQPKREVVLVDSNSKKVRFLRQVVSELDLPNATPIHSRIEALDVGKFEVITSRAFSSLTDFVALTQDHLTDDGALVAMKGKLPMGEIDQLKTAWRIQSIALQVPDLAEDRCVVVLNRR